MPCRSGRCLWRWRILCPRSGGDRVGKGAGRYRIIGHRTRDVGAVPVGSRDGLRRSRRIICAAHGRCGWWLPGRKGLSDSSPCRPGRWQLRCAACARSDFSADSLLRRDWSWNFGSTMAARIAITTMTTSISISVKPRREILFAVNHGYPFLCFFCKNCRFGIVSHDLNITSPLYLISSLSQRGCSTFCPFIHNIFQLLLIFLP